MAGSRLPWVKRTRLEPTPDNADFQRSMVEHALVGYSIQRRLEQAADAYEAAVRKQASTPPDQLVPAEVWDEVDQTGRDLLTLARELAQHRERIP